jgi:clostripain
LIFWNHGAGARSTESSPVLTKGVCSDDDNGDILYMNEVQESLSNNFNQNDKLTVIGFDACLMATVEVAYEFRDLAKFMVGSMHTEQGDGWDYEYIFGNLNGSNDESILTGENLVKLVVESYEQFIENYGYNSGETQSAIDLSKLNNLKSSIDQLANAMYLENKKSTIENIRNNSVYYDDGYMADYPYFDLYDFVYKVSTSSLLSTTLKNSANNVISNMREAILKTYGESGNGQSYYYAEDSNAARGLSIFFSRNSSDYYTQKDWYTSKDAFNTSDLGDGYLDFPTTTEDGIVNTWKELMNAWY